MLRLAEPPYRLKSKTTQSFTPCSRRPTEEEIRRFLGMHKELARRIDRSRGIDSARIKVQSPYPVLLHHLDLQSDLFLRDQRRTPDPHVGDSDGHPVSADHSVPRHRPVPAVA